MFHLTLVQRELLGRLGQKYDQYLDVRAFMPSFC